MTYNSSKHAVLLSGSPSRKYLLVSVQGEDEQEQVEYLEGPSLVERVQKDLLAGRLSIEVCREIIQYLRNHDAPTRQRLERILAFKGQRAGDITNRVARITADMKRKSVKTLG